MGFSMAQVVDPMTQSQASIIGQLAVGLVLALALDRVPRGSGVFRTLLIVPWAFPAIITAFAWKWILNDVYGFLPNLATTLGLTDKNMALLGNPATTFWVALLINIWFGAPMFMVNILSALKTIPQEQYEAAMVDGASGLQRSSACSSSCAPSGSSTTSTCSSS